MVPRPPVEDMAPRKKNARQSLVGHLGRSVQIPREKRQFRRRATVCAADGVALSTRQKDLGRTLELYPAQTASEAISHRTRGRVCPRRTMGRRFGRRVRLEEIK